MKTPNTILPRRLLSVSLLSLSLIATARADGFSAAADASVDASADVSMAAMQALANSGRVSMAVSAAPILAVGSVGAAVGASANTVGDDLLDAARTPIGKPLPVSDESFSVGVPPDRALAQAAGAP